MLMEGRQVGKLSLGPWGRPVAMEWEETLLLLPLLAQMLIGLLPPPITTGVHVSAAAAPPPLPFHCMLLCAPLCPTPGSSRMQMLEEACSTGEGQQNNMHVTLCGIVS